MRKLIFIAAILISIFAQGQTYYINDGGRIETCQGTFSIRSYTAGSTFTQTFCSPNPDQTHITISITSHNLGSTTNTSTLCGYDGDNISAPLLSCQGRTNSQSAQLGFISTSNNNSGCITVVFTSNSTSNTTWTGTISCNFMCQPITVNLVNTVPAANGVYTDVCWDETQRKACVTFTGNANFASGLSYNPTNANSTFKWEFGDGQIAEGQGLTTTSHCYTNRQGYDVKLTVTDSRGCISTNTLGQRVRVSLPPTAWTMDYSRSAVCLNQELTANSTYDTSCYSLSCFNPVATTICLPDEPPICYETSITMDCFAPGQRLQSGSDLASICMKLEHTYLGDLTFDIVCPPDPSNGGLRRSVVLEPQDGSGTDLGSPGNCNNNVLTGGSCKDYCITESASQTMGDAGTGGALPAGNYKPFESYSGLVGCPLNGQWTLKICDKWANDDGTSCGWTINFAPHIIPEQWGYCNTYNAIGWTGGTGAVIVHNPGNNAGMTGKYTSTSNITIDTQNPFTFTLVDNFGCNHDSTKNITVLANSNQNCCIQPNPTISAPNSVCGNNATLEIVGGFSLPGNIGSWTVTPAAPASFDDASSPTATVTVTQYTTYTFTWHEYNNSDVAACSRSVQKIIEFKPRPTANAGPDVQVCGLSNTITAVISQTGNTGTWTSVNGATVSSPSNPTTLVTINDTQYGRQQFMWVETNGLCSDTAYASVTFVQIPVVNAGVDRDTCSNSISLCAIPSYYPGRWSAVRGGTTISSVGYYPYDTVPCVNVIIPPMGSNSEIYTFEWRANNQGCIGSDQVVITFSKPQFDADAGYDVYVCDTTATLGAFDQNGLWTENYNGLYIATGNETNRNANIYINPNSIDFGDSSRFVAKMFWTAIVGNCSSRDSAKVTLYQKPKADAGINNSVCGLAYQFEGVTSVNAWKGVWILDQARDTSDAIISIPYVQYDTIGSPTASITVGDYGTYTFVWKEMNLYANDCFTTDTVIIEFVKYPEVFADDDQWICGSRACLSASEDVSTGIWDSRSRIDRWLTPAGVEDPMQQMNKNACLEHLTSDNDTVIMVRLGHRVGTYGMNPAQCVTRDSVNLFFFVNEIARTYVLNSDTTQCGLIMTGKLNAQPVQEANSVGEWIDIPQSGLTETTFLPNANALNTTANTTGSGGYGKHTYYWIVTNGRRPNGSPVCVDTAGPYPVRYIEIPTVNAGGHYNVGLFGPNSEIKTDTMCGLVYPLFPDTTPGINVAHKWISGTPNFAPLQFSGNNPFDTVRAVTANTQQGSAPLNQWYQFIFQEDNGYFDSNGIFRSHGCIDKDTLRVTFALNPSGAIAFVRPYCFGRSAKVWAQPDALGKPNEFIWSVTNGNIVSSDPFNDTINVVWGRDTIAEGVDIMRRIELTTKNQWGCYSDPQDTIVMEPGPRFPIKLITSATCGNNNGRIDVTVVDSINSSYRWLGADSVALGLPYNPRNYRDSLYGESNYLVRFQYDSWSPNNPCKDTLSFFVPDTGQVDIKLIANGTIVNEGDTIQGVDIISGAEINFDASQSINGRTFKFEFGDNTTASSASTIKAYSSASVFTIRLTVISRDGCEAVMIFYLKIKDGVKMDIPNIFSPNGDGKNDYFQVSAKSLKTFEGKIINRWGKVIYTWDKWQNEQDGWNGLDEDGKIAAPGVYYYLIKATGIDAAETKFEEKGYLHLVTDKK